MERMDFVGKTQRKVLCPKNLLLVADITVKITRNSIYQFQILMEMHLPVRAPGIDDSIVGMVPYGIVRLMKNHGPPQNHKFSLSLYNMFLACVNGFLYNNDT
jgi:hypothetical protein